MKRDNLNKKINLLIIEDNEDDVFFIKKALEPKIFNIKIITSGIDALDYLLSPDEMPDVVLLDKNLPGINGLEILEELYKKNITYGVVFLTIDNNIDTVIKAMNLGAMDFVVKSQNLKNELLQKVMRVYNIQKSLIEKKLLEKEADMAKKSVEFTHGFLAYLSHELRTPITGVIGMAEVMLKTKLSEEQTDYMNTIIHSGENLRETINLTLDYLKLETGQKVLKIEPFAFDEILQAANNTFNSLCRKPIVYKTLSSPEIPVSIICDKLKLKQVVNNFLSNAIKHTEKGEIVLKAEIEKSYDKIEADNNKNLIKIKIEVSDTGPGISEQEQKVLFKPFSTVNTKVYGRFDSSGLGLSISKDICEMLGGEIGVSSKPGAGSTFWFTFIAEVPTSFESKDDSIIQQSSKKISSLSILLVEDQMINRKVIGLMLESMDHSVSFASNGQEALDVFSPGVFDVILMDIQMPVMDGITATKKFKEKYDNLPLIVGLSAYAFDDDIERFINLGMDDYIIKPMKENDFNVLLKKYF